ncbi:MAG: bifunctional methylenetetrahydrofolate dehydrogenase/methenyltetrahydrofolate cyclohydrolase FolD [Oricola sp.]|nr:bifunctional methylenetetrahydrofolate dehydrogenase/methenyltetrahydrofolate cyclohydrolase FolD [Oricola sp.]
MTASIIDGKGFAAKVRGEVGRHVKRLKDEHGITPGLAVVLVGEDPASQVYVRSKGKQTVEAGMNSYEHKRDASISQEELLALVEQLNGDPAVHGILVQLPLPDHIDEDLVINAIDPAKDVDGFHISNVGLLGTGQESMVPCTPLGCLMMLRDFHGSLSGMNAVVVGRSNIVGKPMAIMLMGQDATVAICHAKTRDLAQFTILADILVVAAGVPNLILGQMVKTGAVVIDVGINRLPDGRLVGDVDFEGVSKKASYITPVPGGVGPMTVTMLLENTVISAERSVARKKRAS